MEAKQRLIESSFQSLRQLRHELTSLNQEAQFNDDKIHSFLAAFLPDYKLFNQNNSNSLSGRRPSRFLKAKPPVEEEKVIPVAEVPQVPQVQVQFKVANSEELDEIKGAKLPMPSVSYEWSDSEGLSSMHSYMPRLGKQK